MKYKSQGEGAAERCKFSFQFKFLFAALLKVVAAKLRKKSWPFLLDYLNW